MANLSVEVVDDAGVTRRVRPVDAKEILAQGGSPAAPDKGSVPSPKADDDAAPAYAKMRKADLVALASERGIEITPDEVTVAQIIALLEEADG